MKCFKHFLNENKTFTTADAKSIGDALSVDWNKVDLEQFKLGLGVETEHDNGDQYDIIKSNKDLAKVVLAHLQDSPSYYTKLKSVEEDAPANSVSSGGVAGLKDPLFPLNKKSILRRTRKK